MMVASGTAVTGLARNRSASWLAVLLLVCAVGLGGCTMSETEQRTASGAGIGAAVGAAGGAIIGALVGSPGTGAAIGAAAGGAVGGAGGYIHDQQVKRNTADTEADRLRLENQRLQQQLDAQDG